MDVLLQKHTQYMLIRFPVQQWSILPVHSHFCDGDSVMLTVNPRSKLSLVKITYIISSPANTNDTLYASVSGTYSVIVTTLNGCAYPAISPVTVTVNPNPVVNISGDTVFVWRWNLKLVTAPIGGATYSWIGPNANGNTNPFVKTNIQLVIAAITV